MNKAFTKEDDERIEALPERPVSPHPNLVTAAGFAAIEAELARLQARLGDVPADDPSSRAATARDLRYWQTQRDRAQVVEPSGNTEVQFGSRVAIRREDGLETTYRIVGVDEADPKNGSVSYVSPLAQAMMGKSTGDSFRVASRDATIVRIS